MTTMKEELARAIARRRGMNPDTHLVFGDKCIWEYFIDDVDSVLERLEGPSADMVKAGDNEIPDNVGFTNDARAVYLAMIKEARK